MWQETAAGDYTLVAELPQRPAGEALDRILMGEQSSDSSAQEPGQSTVQRQKRGGFLSELQSFIKALTQ